jgi:hypothetical protein
VLTAEAVDKAGNIATSSPLNIRVVAASAQIQAPVPVGNPAITGRRRSARR